jgi:hypothetical protein
MKYALQNGWTKERMIEAIQTRNTGSKCISGVEESCSYGLPGADQNHCGVGCFISDEDLALLNAVLRKHPIAVLFSVYPHLHQKMPISLEGLKQIQKVHDCGPSYSDPRPALIAWIEKNVEQVQK